MFLRRSTLLLVLLIASLAVVAFASACGGSETTTISGAATSIQTMTTAAPTTTAPAAANIETYRAEMKTLWDQYGPTLTTMDDAIDLVDPTNLSETEVQAVQSFLDALKGFAGGLQKIEAPAEVATAHAKYTDVLSRLATGFDEFLTATKAGDSNGAMTALTAIGALFEQEDAAMTEATATLEKALGFSLMGGDSSSTDTTTPPLGSDAQTYTDAANGYSFQYPGTWKISDQTSIDAIGGNTATSQVAAYDPSGVATTSGIYVDLMMVSTYKLNATISDADLPALESELQTLIDGLAGQGNNAQLISPLALTEVNGLKGYTAMYSFDKEDVACTTTLYFLFKGDVEYMLTIQAANQNWESDQDIFAAMVASFTAP